MHKETSVLNRHMFPLDCFSSSELELWDYYHKTVHAFIMHKRSTYSNTKWTIKRCWQQDKV